MNCKLFIKGKVCLPAAIILAAALLTFPLSAGAQEPAEAAVPTAPASQPILNVDTGQVGDLSDDPSVEELIGEEDMAAMRDSQAAIQQSTGGMSFHEQLKSKFVEGSAGFMSLVALALVLGLAFCIERIIYLTLSEINAKKLMRDIDQLVERDDVEGAKTLCRNTRGPVASICYQGLMHAHEDMDTVERSIVSYGAVQSGNLEKGCSWIRLFIAMAPSLGFLGTVIGMVMSFDQIQEAGDISPTIVASGMKVALITTIFGIIVALILQVFYNFILSKIEHLTSQMEESAITLLDIIMKQKLRHQSGTGTAQMKA